MSSTYRIRIKGHLDPEWADWFEGMTLSRQEDGATLLTGAVADQPALQGLLTRIHSLGLTITLVEQLDEESNQTRKW